MSLVKKQIILLLSVVCLSVKAFAQSSGLTATQIVQRAIDSTGGDAAFDSQSSMEFITHIITGLYRDTVSLAVKRNGSTMYMSSTLGMATVNTTTIYNNGSAVTIANGVVKKVTDAALLEDLKLQCYFSLDYAFKKLGYKLLRLDDQKFQYYDCYTVMVTSPLGKATLNYYDKKTGRRIMSIYPSTNKAIFTNYHKEKGILIPSEVLMTDPKNKVSESSMQNISIGNLTDTGWFRIPTEENYNAPAAFKTGRFRYTNTDNQGWTMIRTATTQTENNPSLVNYKIEWTNGAEYMLYPEGKPLAVKARFVGSFNNKYYCHYLLTTGGSGTCVFERIGD